MNVFLLPIPIYTQTQKYKTATMAGKTTRTHRRGGRSGKNSGERVRVGLGGEEHSGGGTRTLDTTGMNRMFAPAAPEGSRELCRVRVPAHALF